LAENRAAREAVRQQIVAAEAAKRPAQPRMQATRAHLGRGTGSVAEEAGAERAT
jgi:hypothetical protein